MDELTRRKILAAGAMGGASLATTAAATSFGNPDRPPQGAVNAKGTSGADEIPGPQSKPIMDQFGSSVSPPPTDDVALADWLAHTPPQMVAAHLNLPDSVIAKLIKAERRGGSGLSRSAAFFQEGSQTMIRCVRIWTGDDGDSHFEEGVIDLPGGERGDVLSGKIAATSISFRETKPGGTFAWHDAPTRQLVITLAGKLDFQTHLGEHFIINPGDILLAEDTTGRGHSWQLVDDEPWRRAYVIIGDAEVPYTTAH